MSSLSEILASLRDDESITFERHGRGVMAIAMRTINKKKYYNTRTFSSVDLEQGIADVPVLVSLANALKELRQ